MVHWHSLRIRGHVNASTSRDQVGILTFTLVNARQTRCSNAQNASSMSISPQMNTKQFLFPPIQRIGFMAFECTGRMRYLPCNFSNAASLHAFIRRRILWKERLLASYSRLGLIRTLVMAARARPAILTMLTRAAHLRPATAPTEPRELGTKVQAEAGRSALLPSQ